MLVFFKILKLKHMDFLSKFWLSASFMFDPVQFFFNGNFWEIFCKKFSNYTNGNVLDLACGTGELRRWIKPKSYIGVDINPSYIKYAKSRFGENGTKFELGDITNFNLKTHIDTAFLISAVHHLTDEQLKNTFKNLRKYKVKNLIVIDGYPKQPSAPLLVWLDDFLAGGKYFRGYEEIAKLVKPFYKINKSGKFYAKNSFYSYPYVLATYGKLQPGPVQKARKSS